MTSNVESIPTQVPRAIPATFKQALFVAVTAGLGYGFDSYAVNIYGLVLPDIKKTLHITDAEAGYIGYCAGRANDQHRRLHGAALPHWCRRRRRARGRRAIHC